MDNNPIPAWMESVHNMKKLRLFNTLQNVLKMMYANYPSGIPPEFQNEYFIAIFKKEVLKWFSGEVWQESRR